MIGSSRLETVRASSSNRSPRLAREAIGFLCTPDGSRVVLVPAGPGRPHGVGYLDSEGGTDTLGDSLEAFLHAWARGESNVMDLDDEEATGRSKLLRWLKTNGVEVPRLPPFDFDAYLEGRDPAPAPAPSQEEYLGLQPVRLTTELPPMLERLTKLMGRRADDPELVSFVTEKLKKKIPVSTTEMSDTKDVSVPRLGVELLFSHVINNDGYPPVAKTKSSFVPYLSFVFLSKKLGEPLPFGTEFEMPEQKVIEMLGEAPEWNRIGAGFHRYLDMEREILYSVYAEKKSTHAIQVRSARDLSAHNVPERATVGLFIAWALGRGLVDEGRFPAHSGLLNDIKGRKAKGSNLVDAALPRGLWDDHLHDLPGLRTYVFGYFHNIGGKWLTKDMCAVFGSRQGPYGHDEPVLDDDGWDKVDKAAALLDERLEEWVGSR